MATDPRLMESRSLDGSLPTVQRPPIPRLKARTRRVRLDRGGRGLSRSEFRLDARSASLLDEAHRRIKDNMQAIERRLRLGPGPEGQWTTEALLTEFQHRLQLQADLHRTLCRSGCFDQVDLAVYLRQAASALSAACGRGLGDPPDSAGWVLDAEGNRLAWIHNECDTHLQEDRPGDLLEALRLVPKAKRAAAHRAVCAVAMVAPPSAFTWKPPAFAAPTCGCSGPTPRSTAAFELHLNEDPMRVVLSISDRSAFLPSPFQPGTRSELAGQIAGILTGLCAGDVLPLTFEVSL